jgi:uncharacterized protein YdaU (DUF1376 family)
MPLWIGAYLADTQHLSRDEHGGYLLLIMAYWRTQAPLPDDDKRLAAIVKASAKEWRALRPALAEFFDCANGLWRHKRIDQELTEAGTKKKKAQAKAHAAAQTRWGDAPSNAPSNAPSIQQAMLEQCPTPTPSPTPEKPVGRGSPPHDGELGQAAAKLAIALRKQGVNITPANPYLLRWLSEGCTPRQIQDALEIARASKPAPAPMPVKYLDTVLRSPQTRSTKNRKRSLQDERAETIAALTGASRQTAGAEPAAGTEAREPIESTSRRMG